MIELKTSPLIAKLILKFNPFQNVLVMCKGYNEDYENYTELVWKDDKNLDFYNKEDYPEFQLWIQARTKGTGEINPNTGKRRPITRAFYARKCLIRELFGDDFLKSL